MDSRKQPFSDTPVLSPFAYGGLAFLVLLIAANPVVAVLAFVILFGLIVPPLLILSIVRGFNRKDDPRLSRRPHEPP